jgi:glucosamine--fructose-6-phosphate aminotransferase (isomerizing)
MPVANAIAITQSGETADVLISMKKLMHAGCSVLAITNVKGSSADRLADKTLYAHAGLELSVAATKASLLSWLSCINWFFYSRQPEKLKQELISN